MRVFNADGWFATGDIGILEEVLYQHPKVLEAAAVGVPDPRLGERVCACVVPRPGESLSSPLVVISQQRQRLTERR